jgi:hypothetical protein
LRAPVDWMPGLAAEAQARGERLLGEVGFGGPSHRLDKKVQISIGEPIRFPSKTVLPMFWRARGGEHLFPTLDADVEVATLGRTRTQLSVSARYRTPLGVLGRIIDRALLHRVAEATLKDFLDRTGESLQSLCVPA